MESRCRLALAANAAFGGFERQIDIHLSKWFVKFDPQRIETKRIHAPAFSSHRKRIR